jgi:citrate lyase gamma subunit
VSLTRCAIDTAQLILINSGAMDPVMTACTAAVVNSCCH